MDKLPRLSQTEMYIINLLLLKRRQLSPSQMLEVDREKRLNKNTIYVIIGRMVDKGLLESEYEKKKPGQKGRPRRLFNPTGIGVQALRSHEVAEKHYANLQAGVLQS